MCSSDLVTDRRQTESRMAHMAYHDGLTDLPNRAAFLQALAQMIEACAGTDEEFAVLCVDLDGLKEINDVFGHAMGDKLLIEVSRRIQASARGGVVARLSGEGLLAVDDQPELVAAEPGDDAAARRGLEAARYLDQEPVADRMAEHIVDFLQPVEIDRQHREFLIGARAGFDHLRQRLQERRAVRQIRQTVMIGHMRHP